MSAPRLSAGRSACATSSTSASAETHETTASHLGPQGGERRVGRDFELFGERACLLGGAVVDAREQPRLGQVARHVRSHGTESDKTYTHVFEPRSAATRAAGATIEGVPRTRKLTPRP